MRALPSDRMRAFARACTQPSADGTVNYTLAAELAGYGTGNRNSLKVMAHKLAHDPRVQAAIAEEGQRFLGGAVLVATGTLIQIASNPRAEDKDRLKAAGMILDRAGLHAKSEHHVEVVKKDTPGEQVERIMRMVDKLGLSEPEKKALYARYGIPYKSDMSDDVAAFLEEIS